MVKRILVAIEGSANTGSVVKKSVRMSKHTGAALHAVGIIDRPAIMHPEPVPVGAYEFLEQKHQVQLSQAEERVDSFLKEFEQICKNESIASYSVQKLIGDPVEKIAEESVKHDLILLPRGGNFKFMTQQARCKTVEDVIKINSRPVVVVPEELHESGKGILVLTDGSYTASRAVQLYQLLGLYGKRSVHLLSVQKNISDAEKICSTTAEYLKLHGIQAIANPVESDQKPGVKLLEYLTENPPQVLVMGAYGVGGLKEFLFGSVTKDLLEKSNIPLFIYH